MRLSLRRTSSYYNINLIIGSENEEVENTSSNNNNSSSSMTIGMLIEMMMLIVKTMLGKKEVDTLIGNTINTTTD